MNTTVTSAIYYRHVNSRSRTTTVTSSECGCFTAQYRYIYWLFSPDCGLQDYCIQYVSVVQKGGHKTFNKINLSLFVSDVYGIQINFPNNIPTMWAYNILLTASLLAMVNMIILLTMYVTALAQTQCLIFTNNNRCILHRCVQISAG